MKVIRNLSRDLKLVLLDNDKYAIYDNLLCMCINCGTKVEMEHLAFRIIKCGSEVPVIDFGN